MAQVLLAPMEGLIDDVMRAALTRVQGYDACVTEFVRVTDAVLPIRAFRRVAPELFTGARTSSGTPVCVQLLGSDSVCMADNAARLAELAPAGIDLNFGCPAPLVNRHGGGAVLLDEPELLYRITQACSRAIEGRVPFTAKMRLGVRDKSLCHEAASALEAGGAEQLVVHARTRDEFYRPPAHWEWVARVAEGVSVPVVANGEIWTVEDYRRCLAESAVPDVMLGRGAVADPFLVERIRAWQAGATPRVPEDDWPRVSVLLRDYWLAVLNKLPPRHSPGRIKQWLGFLRRTYVAADALQKIIRPLNNVDEINRALKAAGVM